MDGILERRPKSLTLLWLAQWHRPALDYDWRTRFNLPLSSIFDGTLRWADAWRMCTELLRRPNSHIMSALRGDKYVPSDAEYAAWSVLEQELNAKRPRGKIPQRIDRPWAGKRPNYGNTNATDVIDPARDRRRAILASL